MSAPIKIKPFLRWAGGKTWLTKHIHQYLLREFENYFEPFLGGGSIYFFLKNNNLVKGEVTLADVNSGLIECYKTLRDKPELVVNELKKYKNQPSEYYLERSLKYNTDFEEAAKFIFLNRTSFNGIYRENLKGEYNVPYGYKTYKTLFDFDNMMRVSEALQNTKIEISDFGETLNKIGTSDFTFIDPPYTVAHENNGFVKYNQKIFSWNDQIRLKDNISMLHEKGAFYILTNAFHKSLIDLYEEIDNSNKIERYSVVGGNNAKREKYSELIITNLNGQTNF